MSDRLERAVWFLLGVAMCAAFNASAEYELECDRVTGFCPTIRDCPGGVGRRQIGYTCGPRGDAPAYQCCSAEGSDCAAAPYVACTIKGGSTGGGTPDRPDDDVEPTQEPDKVPAQRKRRSWEYTV